MIEKILNNRKIIYSSNLTEDHLKAKIEDVFKRKTLDLVGKFTSQNKFAASDNWTYIKWYVPNFKRKTAYLKGEIIESENEENETLIKLNIKPNPVISVFPIFLILIGTIIIAAAELNNENNKALIFGILVMTAGILYYLFGMFLTNRLQSNFKKYLDLQNL